LNKAIEPEPTPTQSFFSDASKEWFGKSAEIEKVIEGIF
jgi:hypothetical protein